MLSVGHFLLKGVALFGGDFDGAWEPAGESAIEKRVAHEKHENNGKERDGDSADDHFGFEASTELFAAALGPETDDGTRDD